MEDTQLRKEDCRRAVRAHLADRPAIAQGVPTIHRHLRRENDFTLSEVQNAARFLVALEHLKEVRDPLGATVSYQATATGILAHERGE